MRKESRRAFHDFFQRPGLHTPVPSGVKQGQDSRSEEHTSELQSPCNLVCRLLLEKKKKKYNQHNLHHPKTNINTYIFAPIYPITEPIILLKSLPTCKDIYISESLLMQELMITYS